MTTIKVYGWGTDLSVTPIPEHVFKELTDASVTEERLMDIEAEYWMNRLVWVGFSVSPDQFEILVNGQTIADDVLNNLNVRVNPYKTMPPRICYLVVEETLKGLWTDIKSRKKFRPELVLLDPETIMLPSGERYDMLALYFDGKSEFGSTVGKMRDVYVVSAEGKRYALTMVDDDQ